MASPTSITHEEFLNESTPKGRSTRVKKPNTKYHVNIYVLSQFVVIVSDMLYYEKRSSKGRMT